MLVLVLGPISRSFRLSACLQSFAFSAATDGTARQDFPPNPSLQRGNL